MVDSPKLRSVPMQQFNKSRNIDKSLKTEWLHLVVILVPIEITQGQIEKKGKEI